MKRIETGMRRLRGECLIETPLQNLTGFKISLNKDINLEGLGMTWAYPMTRNNMMVKGRKNGHSPPLVRPFRVQLDRHAVFRLHHPWPHDRQAAGSWFSWSPKYPNHPQLD